MGDKQEGKRYFKATAEQRMLLERKKEKLKEGIYAGAESALTSKKSVALVLVFPIP